MNIMTLFGKSPFGPLVEHTRKVHECVGVVRPLMEALLKQDYEEVHRLQDRASKLEYEADKIKHRIRERLTRRFFFAVDRDELENFLRCQDRIADSVEDFAIILLIRNTKIHPGLKDEFLEFIDQVLRVSSILMDSAEKLEDLSRAAFAGQGAKSVLKGIANLGEEEWMADRMQRKLSQHIYRLEQELDPLTIVFYDKMLHALSRIANEAENTGDLLRIMIIKG